jgi:hypothetical protein
VGERFGSGELSMEICGREVQVEKVVVGEMWVRGSDRESFG